MPFLKKAEVTRQKIAGLIEKEKSLNDDLIRTAKKVEKRKNEVSSLLGKIALGENRLEDQKDLDSLKTLYGKAQDEHTDLLVMIDMVRREKQLLGFEVDEATLRETPEEMEAVASKFNSKLDVALKSLSTLENDFVELQGLENNFISLSNGRKNSLSKLGRLDSLEIRESLGRLALTPSPYGFTFSCGLELKTFVGNLQSYKKKCEDFEKFQVDNPNYFENVKLTREQQKEKPWARMTANWSWF